MAASFYAAVTVLSVELSGVPSVDKAAVDAAMVAADVLQYQFHFTYGSTVYIVTGTAV